MIELYGYGVYHQTGCRWRGVHTPFYFSHNVNYIYDYRVEHCDCSLVLYGHTARVWDARLLPTVIVSVGEDATCKLWDYSGRCLNTVGGHSGRSIWSMAVSADNTVVVCTCTFYDIQSTDHVT